MCSQTKFILFNIEVVNCFILGTSASTQRIYFIYKDNRWLAPGYIRWCLRKSITENSLTLTSMCSVNSVWTEKYINKQIMTSYWFWFKVKELPNTKSLKLHSKDEYLIIVKCAPHSRTTARTKLVWIKSTIQAKI